MEGQTRRFYFIWRAVATTDGNFIKNALFRGRHEK
jgi:hypothetical protein